MKAIIVGGGIGGLTTALMLQARGIGCAVFEQSAEPREIGVGINTLPNAIQELAGLGLLDRLDAVAIRTRELLYCNRFGQIVWREPRGLDAGFPVPQFSIHRGRLHGVLHKAARERLGGEIHHGRRLAGFEQTGTEVVAHFVDRHGAPAGTARGDVLIGADGIHSIVRDTLYPDQGPPSWNGVMMWRGAIDWPATMDGRTMIVAGGMQAKVVLYPIAAGTAPDRRLTNWVVCARIGDGSAPPPRREDWSRPGRLDEVLPHARRFALPEADIAEIVQATPEFWEYPMCDRDPLPRWRHGRVTLLGDAAHPMYPVGSNGASQAILDARALADALADTADAVTALERYEADRRPKTAEIVRLNRSGGPEGVIDVVEQLAPDGFEDIEAVLSHEERQAIVRGYATVAGFTPAQLRRPR
ncbi:flavin-dependent oxidoreductase [Inquilinus limosus]|uniref:flavin-dependent oxidoreductase n=1 Tax=Inquilinus limosus TaxID=171674 RepID=UPI00041A0F23|nr:flavin-dependent oxidoreductase [Inquilinus limosus]